MQGPAGPAGQDAIDTTTFVQILNRGTGIIFKNLNGGLVSSFGTGSVSSGIISKDFTADPCPLDQYIKSIDSNGAVTCVSTYLLPGTVPPIKTITVIDTPASIFGSAGETTDLRVNSVIQIPVNSTCAGPGRVIKQIKIDGSVSCGTIPYCEIVGSDFNCYDSAGQKTTITIPN
jgi:hypothetical protein